MSANIDGMLAVGIDLHFVIWQVIESTIYQLIQNEKKKVLDRVKAGERNGMENHTQGIFAY